MNTVNTQSKQQNKTSSKEQLKNIFVAVLGGVAIAAAFFTYKSHAYFNTEDAKILVEIDGLSYGAFDTVEELSEVFQVDSIAEVAGAEKGDQIFTVRLYRSFVTDPSLYLWAKNSTSLKEEPKDVTLIVKDESGHEITRYLLKGSQPISWSIESPDNGAVNGFTERVDLAVQEVHQD